MVTCWRAVVPHGRVHVAYTIRSDRTPKVFVAAANADIAVAARRVSLPPQRATNTLSCECDIVLMLQSNLTLQDVRVVLTSPKSPGNIGSVARAAENFEVLTCARSSTSASLIISLILSDALPLHR